VLRAIASILLDETWKEYLEKNGMMCIIGMTEMRTKEETNDCCKKVGRLVVKFFYFYNLFYRNKKSTRKFPSTFCKIR
jgi:hypothetical protein